MIERLNWKIEDLPKPTSDQSLMRSQLDEFGYCIIDNALSPAHLISLQDRLVEQAEMERDLRRKVLHLYADPRRLDVSVVKELLDNIAHATHGYGEADAFTLGVNRGVNPDQRAVDVHQRPA